MEEALTIVLPVGTFVVGIVVGWFARYRIVALSAEVLKVRADSLAESKAELARAQALVAEAFKAKDIAVSQARSEWSASISPYKRINDGFFSSYMATGYQCQLLYKGIPVGEPTVRIVCEEKKVKKEEIERLLKAAELAANVYAQSLRQHGAPAELRDWS